jgi:hypothetical protein
MWVKPPYEDVRFLDAIPIACYKGGKREFAGSSRMKPPTFRLDVSFDDKTGNLIAVYLRAREGEVARTKEIKEGLAYADYDAEGVLLGIELLGPCDVKELDGIADNEPEPVRGFLKKSVPRGLVPA